MPFISQYGLVHLTKYKYSSSQAGWIDNNIMNPFWNWILEFVPMWLAPNLITFLSLLHGAFATALLLYYCPTMSEVAPNWVYFVYAYCMFLYQTLDAIDGKQARRTGTSSPLGQLFDHGCDALCCYFTGVSNCCLLQLGQTWFSFGAFLMAIVPFFCVNWEEAQTHRMRFGVLSVTEAQLTIILLHCVTGVLGPQIWTVKLYDSYGANQCMAAFASVFVFFALADSIWHVVDYFVKEAREEKHHKDDHHHRHHHKALHEAQAQQQQSVSEQKSDAPAAVPVPKSPEAGDHGFIAASLQMVQFLGCLSLIALWLHLDPALLQHHAVAVLSLTGLLFAYLTSRLIVAHVTDSPYDLVFPLLWPLPILVAHSLIPAHTVQSSAFLLRSYLVLVAFVYFHYVSSAVNEITSFLGIHCFVIKPKPKDA